MKSRIAMLAVLLGAMLWGPTAMAQTGARFNIPFAFSANHHYVPAGTYNVWLVDAGHKLKLVNVQTGTTAFVLVRPDQASQAADQGYLVFWSKDGNRYLEEVRMPNSMMLGKLPLPAALQLEIAQVQQPAAPGIAIAAD